MFEQNGKYIQLYTFRFAKGFRPHYEKKKNTKEEGRKKERKIKKEKRKHIFFK